MPLPNFFVVGAAHSGTTSLHHYLSQHPQVLVSPVKEPSFFAFESYDEIRGPGSRWLRDTSVLRREEYEALFDGAGRARAVGEVSPRYLFTPESAGRIRRLVPAARIVAILRDPVDSAFSAFLHRRREGWEPCDDLSAAVDDEPRRAREAWSMGLLHSSFRHATNLSRYYEQFPPEQILVLFHEDLQSDPGGLMTALLDFLGVDPAFETDVSRHYNRSGVIPNPLVRAAWRKSYGVRRALRPILPARVRDAAYAWVTRDLDRPELDPVTRRSLVALYREEILRLEELVERDLSHWLDPAPAPATARSTPIPGGRPSAPAW